ncbi:MAG TPA: serine/threonine-protein kinase [Candidatus Nanoarchaeia archaeon]|nr:serine/threonine-protein kinase [Candidatus Nanoarchaeia archaeon]
MPESALDKPRTENSPRVIHSYTLLEELGRGSFATAYRAMKDRQEYCVREMDTRRIDRRRRDEVVKLFIRENKVLSELDHPYIPKVHDFFESTEQGELVLYQVQDLVPGVCLKSLVHPEQTLIERAAGEKIGKPFAEEQVVEIGLKLSKILAYLHNQPVPVVHRDVKPSNIMLNPATRDTIGDIYLIDFGAVQQALIKLEGGSTMFGTPGIAPPELLTGNAVPRSDIYMLGKTLLSLASGMDPRDLSDYLERISYKEQFRFKNPSLEAVVDQMIQFDPESRPESAEQVADYLEKVKAGKRISRPIEDTGRIWKYVAKFLPGDLLKHLVRTRPSDVEKAQRESQSLISEASPRIEVVSGEAKIEKSDEYWTFHGVPFVGRGNEGGILRFTSGLVLDGKSLHQEGYVERLKGSELVLPTVPEYLSLAAYLGQFKDHPVQKQKELFEEATAWLRKMFEDYWLTTGTRADYHPDGSGNVIQGVGRDTVSTADVSALVGRDGFVEFMGNYKPAIEALCGTGDTAYVDQSFRAVSGKDSYLWRININPDVKQERLVVLGVGKGDRFNISADNFIAIKHALGVVTPRARNVQENERHDPLFE